MLFSCCGVVPGGLPNSIRLIEVSGVIRYVPSVALGACLSAVLACGPLAPAAAEAVDASGTDPAAEVARHFRAGIEAFNARDLETFLLQFAEDIQMYAPTGWLRGRDEVRERFADVPLEPRVLRDRR
jgi:hypothetical protein